MPPISTFTPLRAARRLTGFLGVGIDIVGQHPDGGEETLDADGIVAFGTTDIENRRVVRLKQGVQEWMKLRLIAAEEFGNMASFGRLFDKLHSREGSVDNLGATLLHQGILDERTAVFGEQSQGVVEAGFARLRPVEQGE
jgi:hypothetical protein